MKHISSVACFNTTSLIKHRPYDWTISLFVPAVVQKRLRRERRARRRLQEQLETEVKRRMQLEEALKATGAVEQLRIINGAYSILKTPLSIFLENSSQCCSAVSPSLFDWCDWKITRSCFIFTASVRTKERTNISPLTCDREAWVMKLGKTVNTKAESIVLKNGTLLLHEHLWNSYKWCYQANCLSLNFHF